MYRILLSLIVALGIDSDAQANVTGFTNQAPYAAALGAELLIIDFKGMTPGTDVEVFPGQIDVRSPEAVDLSNRLCNANAMTDAGSPAVQNNVGPIDGVFTNAVNAFRLEFSGSGNPQTITLLTRRRL